MGTSMTAMLVEAPGNLGERPGVTTAIPRGEIEEALASEAPLDLVLDVSRAGDGGVETTDVSVTWQRSDLESLLARMDADAIILSFDRSQLERALDADFEGHGIREALLLTAAAASASAAVATSTASGQLMDAGGGGGPTAAAVAPGHGEAGTARDLAAPVGIHDEATAAARGVGQTVAGADEATLAARGVETVAPSARDESTLASRGIEPGTLAASHDEATLAARGVGLTPAPGMDEATLAARGIGHQSLPASHDEATLAARGVGGPEVVAAESGSGLELPSVDQGTAAAIGGLAGAGLIIAAAGFAARRNRVGTV